MPEADEQASMSPLADVAMIDGNASSDAAMMEGGEQSFDQEITTDFNWEAFLSNMTHSTVNNGAGAQSSNQEDTGLPFTDVELCSDEEFMAQLQAAGNPSLEVTAIDYLFQNVIDSSGPQTSNPLQQFLAEEVSRGTLNPDQAS